MAFASNGFNISDAAAKSEASDRQKMWHKRRAAPTPQQGCNPEIAHTGDGKCAGRPFIFPRRERRLG